MRFQYIIKKTIIRMSSDLKANFYGLSTGCRKLYFASVGCAASSKRLANTEL